MSLIPQKIKFLLKFLIITFLLYYVWRYVGQYYYSFLHIVCGGITSLFSFNGKLVSAAKVVAGGKEILYIYKNNMIYQPINLEVISLSLVLYLSLLLATINPRNIQKNMIILIVTSTLILIIIHVVIATGNYLTVFLTSGILKFILSSLSFLNSFFIPTLLWFWTISFSQTYGLRK